MHIIVRWLGLSVFLPLFLFADPLTYKIRGEAAILVNADSGAILFEEDAYSLRYPASTTKIATAIFALHKVGDQLDVPFTAGQDSVCSVTQEAKKKSNYSIPTYWLEPDGSHIGIKNGETLTLRHLLEGMLIASGNDAANVIAHGMGPTIPDYMVELNMYLKSIGCKSTHFLNPHGLHDPNHQTTAFDLAIISAQALKNPIFCEIVSQTKFIRPKTNKQQATTLLQTNRLLRPGKYYYDKAIGIKTGYHSKAKHCLVAASRFEGRTLIAVLLGYKERGEVFEDAISLFDKAFNQPKIQRRYLKEGLQKFELEIPQADRILQTYLREPLALEFYSAEDPQAKCLLYWEPKLSLPIAKDQKVGELHLVDSKGRILTNSFLLSSGEIRFAWPYNWVAAISSMTWGWLLVGFGILALIWLIRMMRR